MIYPQFWVNMFRTSLEHIGPTYMVQPKSGSGRLAGRGKGQPDISLRSEGEEDARSSPSLLLICDHSSCLSGVCLAPTPTLEFAN